MKFPRSLSLPCLGAAAMVTTPAQQSVPQQNPQKAFINRYCSGCHNQRLKSGGFSFDTLDPANVGPHAETWEKVVTKMRAGLMPPAGLPRRSTIRTFLVDCQKSFAECTE